MKKRNWLLTIAFAVLSLTIISSAVIGSTFAKFASNIAGSGKAQAAAFLVTGSMANAEQAVLIAPGRTNNDASVTISYISQVDTLISNVNSSNEVDGTGIFQTSVWNNLVSFYNDHWKELAVYLGYTNKTITGINDADFAITTLDAEGNPFTGGAVKTGLKANQLITTIAKAGESAGNANIAEAFVAAAKAAHVPAYTGGSEAENKVRLGKMTDTAAVNITLNISITWKTGIIPADGQLTDENIGGGDLFDTFIGNCIAAYANGTALAYGPANALEVFAAPTAAQSELKVDIGLRAEQILPAPAA